MVGEQTETLFNRVVVDERGVQAGEKLNSFYSTDEGAGWEVLPMLMMVGHQD